MAALDPGRGLEPPSPRALPIEIDLTLEAEPDFAVGRSGTILLDGVDDRGRDEELHAACDAGDVGRARALIEAGADVNHAVVDVSTGGTYTSLVVASGNGHAECARLLLEAGADVNLAGMRCSSALLAASLGGHVECARLLLAAGADVNYAGVHGCTALMIASARCDEADTDFPGAYVARTSAPACARIDLLTVLLEAGADVEADDNEFDEKNTALTWGSGRLCVVQLLCAYGAWRGKLSNEYAPADCHAWVRETRRWSTQLHHLEFLTPARVRQLLVGGADVHASGDAYDLLSYGSEDDASGGGGDGAPTPLGLAHALLARDPAHEGASLVVAAAAPWSRENHALFPAHVRARAAELLRLGQLLVREARFAGVEGALLDAWPVVMAHALGRSMPARLGVVTAVSGEWESVELAQVGVRARPGAAFALAGRSGAPCSQPQPQPPQFRNNEMGTEEPTQQHHSHAQQEKPHLITVVFERNCPLCYYGDVSLSPTIAFPANPPPFSTLAYYRLNLDANGMVPLRLGALPVGTSGTGTYGPFLSVAAPFNSLHVHISPVGGPKLLPAAVAAAEHASRLAPDMELGGAVQLENDLHVRGASQFAGAVGLPVASAVKVGGVSLSELLGELATAEALALGLSRLEISSTLGKLESAVAITRRTLPVSPFPVGGNTREHFTLVWGGAITSHGTSRLRHTAGRFYNDSSVTLAITVNLHALAHMRGQSQWWNTVKSQDGLFGHTLSSTGLFICAPNDYFYMEAYASGTFASPGFELYTGEDTSITIREELSSTQLGPPVVAPVIVPVLVNLGNAGEFAVLASTSIAITPAVPLKGDVGLNMGSAAITGLGPLVLSANGQYYTARMYTILRPYARKFANVHQNVSDVFAVKAETADTAALVVRKKASLSADVITGNAGNAGIAADGTEGVALFAWGSLRNRAWRDGSSDADAKGSAYAIPYPGIDYTPTDESLTVSSPAFTSYTTITPNAAWPDEGWAITGGNADAEKDAWTGIAPNEYTQWRAFDGNSAYDSTGTFWASSPAPRTSPSLDLDWVQIQYPGRVLLRSYTLVSAPTAESQMTKWTISASNESAGPFEIIQTVELYSWPAVHTSTITKAHSAYRFWRLSVKEFDYIENSFGCVATIGEPEGPKAESAADRELLEFEERQSLLDRIGKYRERFPKLKKRNGTLSIKSSLMELHDEVHYVEQQLGREDSGPAGSLKPGNLAFLAAMYGIEYGVQAYNPLNLQVRGLGQTVQASLKTFEPLLNEFMIKHNMDVSASVELRIVMLVVTTVTTVHLANTGQGGLLQRLDPALAKMGEGLYHAFEGRMRGKYNLLEPSAWHALERDAKLHSEAVASIAGAAVAKGPGGLEGAPRFDPFSSENVLAEVGSALFIVCLLHMAWSTHQLEAAAAEEPEAIEEAPRPPWVMAPPPGPGRPTAAVFALTSFYVGSASARLAAGPFSTAGAGTALSALEGACLVTAGTAFLTTAGGGTSFPRSLNIWRRVSRGATEFSLFQLNAQNAQNADGTQAAAPLATVAPDLALSNNGELLEQVAEGEPPAPSQREQIAGVMKELVPMAIGSVGFDLAVVGTFKAVQLALPSRLAMSGIGNLGSGLGILGMAGDLSQMVNEGQLQQRTEDKLKTAGQSAELEKYVARQSGYDAAAAEIDDPLTQATADLKPGSAEKALADGVLQSVGSIVTAPVEIAAMLDSAATMQTSRNLSNAAQYNQDTANTLAILAPLNMASDTLTGIGGTISDLLPLDAEQKARSDQGALADLQAAINTTVNLVALPEKTNVAGGVIGGRAFYPGVYKWSTAVSVATSVALLGTAIDVFVFSESGNLRISAMANIILIPIDGGVGPQAKNIFWHVLGTVAMGAGNTFYGTVVASGAVTLGAGNRTVGKLLSMASVATGAANTIIDSSYYFFRTRDREPNQMEALSFETVRRAPQTVEEFLGFVGAGTPLKRGFIVGALATLVCYATKWPAAFFTEHGAIKTFQVDPDEDELHEKTQVHFVLVPVLGAVAGYLFL
ncbi:hypothetical protein T492DRAFT_915447 [Pavlovales sp. CCMP2436]|nr:hypothetical protein T492DRAFT_915447 [Pavlovales sp. CCMP2436]